MRNGLYAAAFRTPKGSGSGVVVLADGKIMGGDAVMYYTGTYAETGNTFTAQMKVDRHTAGGQNVFGIDRVNVTLKGTTSGDKIDATGQAKEIPGITFSAALSRLPD